MGNWCSSTKKDSAHNSSATNTIHTTNPKKAMGDKNMSAVVVSSEYNTMVLGSSSSGESTMKSRGSLGKDPKVPTILLLPHQHTLFCERKQRVCTAVGRCQELETLKLAGFDTKSHEWVWFRTNSADIFATKDKRAAASIIAGTENKVEYRLEKEDVGCYIGVVYANLGSVPSSVHEENQQNIVANTVGPVLPGPPRILEFKVTGDMAIGSYAKAETSYIGGVEGCSEYWWMRITSDGKRAQLTDPKACPEANSKNFGNPSLDSRFYLITAADSGCTLKAKCRPTRIDGAQGEIFTSKGSETVRSSGK